MPGEDAPAPAPAGEKNKNQQPIFFDFVKIFYSQNQGSDFVNYKQIPYDEKSTREFDFLYSCPKVSENSACDDWVSHNKNWELAKKCLIIMCQKFNLKGAMIGREGCDFTELCSGIVKV
jgi:hypothetical protein